MADEVKKGNDSKKNVRALQAFRLRGAAVEKDEVVAKSSFPNKQDWQNLLNMPKPRVEETSDPVGKPKVEKATPKSAPGA